MRIIAFFLLLSFSATSQAQKDPIESLRIEIENAIYSGHLNHAKSLVKKLKEKKATDSKQWAYLFLAKIAFYQGDLKGMNTYLPRIKDINPTISFGKNILYGEYLILNNQNVLGYQSLEQALELAKNISDTRIQIHALLTRLQLDYYLKNRSKNKLETLPIHPEARKLFTLLEEQKKEMQLYEKSLLYEIEVKYTSTIDTFSFAQIGQEITRFGIANKFTSSTIIGYQKQAEAAKKTSDQLFFLNKALDATALCEIQQLNSQVYFSLLRYYKEQGHLDSAIYWGKKAILPEFIDLSNALDPYLQLSELYEQKGQLDSALIFRKKAAEKYNETSQKHANNIREYLVNGLQQNLNSKNKILSRNRILIIGVSIFSVLLLFLLFFVWLLSRRLRKVIQEVKQSNTEFEVFSRILSHDLKAPIYTISKLIRYVIEDEKNLNFKSRSYLMAAKDTCENSNLLINNIMTFIRFKEKSITFTDSSWPKMLSAVKANLQEQLTINNVVIQEIDMPKNMYVNDILFIQLLQNLIQNSIKYRQLDEDPLICIQHKNKDNGFILSISDNGKGISAEKSETLLQAFEQDAFISIDNGIGLGLAICSAVVKLHKGSMTIVNNETSGITVTIQIEVKKIQ